MLTPLLQRFAAHNPFALTTRMTLEHALPPSVVDELFERHAERQYTRELTFSCLVELMTAVVFRQTPSVRGAYQRSLSQVGVTLKSLYEKLQGVEATTLRALVQESGRRMGAVIQSLGPTDPWVPGYRIKIVDGNALAPTERRLEPLRELAAAPLPGLSMVVYQPELGVVTDVVVEEDGYRQERSLLPALLDTIEPHDLWMGDRSMGFTAWFGGLVDKQAKFLIREHGSNTLWTATGTRRRIGRVETGVVYAQRIRLQVGPERTIAARRVSLVLDEPTKDGETEVHVVTNVSSSRLSAREAVRLYRQRWRIEGVFLQLTQDLRCEVNTLAYPKAALFGFCTALVGFNALAVSKRAVQVEHGQEEAENLSTYEMVGDVSSAFRALAVVVSEEESESWQQMSGRELARQLREVVRPLDLRRFRKTTRVAKKPPPRKPLNRQQTHLSTARALAARKAAKSP